MPFKATNAHTSPKDDSLARLLPYGALLLAAVAHVAFLQRKGLWNNEFITLSVIRMPWAEMIAERLRLNHMPGYFLMLKAWTDAFGLSAFALRLPSALFSLGAIAVTWLLARDAYGRRTALLAALAAALNQNLLAFSADARMYSAVIFWTLLSMYGYIKLMQRPTLTGCALHFVAGVGGVFFHLLFLLVYPVQILHYVALRLRKATKLPAPLFAGLLTAPLLVWSPWILKWTRVQSKVGQDVWEFPSPSAAVRELLRVAWGDYDFGLLGDGVLRIVSLPAMILLIVLAVHQARRAIRRLVTPASEEKPGALPHEAPPLGDQTDSALAWWLLTPPVLIWLASFRSDTVLSSHRYYVAAGAAAPILLARAADWLTAPRLRRAWVAIVVFLLAWYTLGWAVDTGAGLREVARRIRREAVPGDAVLMNRDRAAREAFPYYGVDLPFHALDRGDYAGLADAEREARLREDVGRIMHDRNAFWLVVYHSGNRSLPDVLDSPEFPFRKHGAKRTFGESRLYRFVRRSGESEPGEER